MSEVFSGKVAFISGGSRGIDRSTVLNLASVNADMAISYYSCHEESGAVCNENRSPAGRSIAVQADVINPKSVKATLDE